MSVPDCPVGPAANEPTAVEPIISAGSERNINSLPALDEESGGTWSESSLLSEDTSDGEVTDSSVICESPSTVTYESPSPGASLASSSSAGGSSRRSRGSKQSRREKRDRDSTGSTQSVAPPSKKKLVCTSFALLTPSNGY